MYYMVMNMCCSLLQVDYDVVMQFDLFVFVVVMCDVEYIEFVKWIVNGNGDVFIVDVEFVSRVKDFVEVLIFVQMQLVYRGYIVYGGMQSRVDCVQVVVLVVGLLFIVIGDDCMYDVVNWINFCIGCIIEFVGFVNIMQIFGVVIF